MERHDVFPEEGNNEYFDKGIFSANTQNLFQMVHNLPVLVYRCLLDDSRKIAFVSHGAVELTGYSAAEILKNDNLVFKRIIHEKDRDSVWNREMACAMPGSRYNLEYRIITKQNEQKWVSDQGRCYINSFGERVIEGVVFDISKYKQAEEGMAYLSFHDKLTGLYNRGFFEEELLRLDTPRQLPLSLVFVDVNGLKLINDVFGHQRGDELLRCTADMLRASCRKEDIICRWGGDEFVVLMPQTTAEVVEKVCARIKSSSGSFLKRFLHLGVAVGSATKEHVDINIMDIFSEAEINMYQHKILEGRTSRKIVLDSLKTEVARKKNQTGDRVEKLKRMALDLGYAIGMRDSQLDGLELLVTVCNVGELSINEDIFNKSGKLDPLEWTAIRKHSEMGYRIARAFPELVHIAEAILFHHERWDGKGYPQGLKGQEIPVFSRILAIIQAYDAMTHTRPYAPKLEPSQALKEIQLCGGTQFDPKLVEIFVGLMQKKSKEAE